MANARSPWSDKKSANRPPKPEPVAPPAPPVTSAPPAPLAPMAPTATAASIGEVLAAPEPVLPRLPSLPKAPAPELPKAPARLPRSNAAPRPAPVVRRAPSLADRLAPLKKAFGERSDAIQAASARKWDPLARASASTFLRTTEAIGSVVDRPPRAAPAIRLPSALALVLGLGVVAVFIAIAALVKLNAFGPIATDETGPVYLARRMAEGARVYADMPSSRPPVHLWLLSILARAGLATWEQFQGAALAFFVVAAVAFAAAARRFGGLVAVVAPVALVAAYEPLAIAARPSGELFALVWISFSLLALAFGRHAVAGVLLGLAVATSLPLWAPVLVFGAVYALVDRAGARRGAIALAASLGAVALVALVLYGPSALTQPFSLSLVQESRLAPFLKARAVMTASGTWVWVALLAPIFAAPERRRLAVAAAGATAAMLVLLVATPVVDRELAGAAWPFAALAVGLALDGVWARYQAWSADGNARGPALWAIGGLAVAIWLGWTNGVRPGIPGDAAPGRKYKASPALASSVAHGLFWADEYAQGANPHVYRRLLWRDTVRSNTFKDMVGIISSQSQPTDLLLGDPALTPLLSLATGRKVAGDLVDAGLAKLAPMDLEQLFAKVEPLQPRFLVMPTKKGLVGQDPFVKWASKEFFVVSTITDESAGWVYIHANRH